MGRMLTHPCLDCGRTGVRHNARGLCSRCYLRRWSAGRDFAGRPPVGPPTAPRNDLPPTRAALAAYCDRQDAALRADIRRRLVAGESLVLGRDGTARVAPTDGPRRVAAH